MLFDCIVTDGTVTAGGVAHRKGSDVKLSPEDAERLELWGTVKIVSRGNVVIENPIDEVPEVTMQPLQTEQPKKKRGRRKK